MRGLFVTGTDTDVGKTVLSAALVAAMRSAGEHVRAFKPVLTGLTGPAHDAPAAARRPSDADPSPAPVAPWPADHELLGALAGMDPEEVAPLRFGPAVSPHLAARLAGVEVDPARLVAAARASALEAHTLIVEGVGGLLVPLAEDYSVCDLAAELGLALVLAARPGLGTINHTLLTLRVARAAGLRVAAVVLTPWPSRPGEIERDNHATIARLGAVEVHTLARVARPDAAELARAGSALPWRGWLEPSADSEI
jgi:dethiobiotin synthetase